MNKDKIKKKIQSCREAALAAIKPSKEELNHGLELHQNAFVMDAYAFGPWAPFNESRIQKLINEGASLDELNNAKDEILAIGYIENPETFDIYKEAWDASGVDAVFLSAGETTNQIGPIIKRYARFLHACDVRRDFFARATTPEDIEIAKKQSKKSYYFSINGVPLPEPYTNVEDMLSYLQTFFQIGCRMMHITYNRRNLLGDGCGEETDCGLSAMGKSAIDEMNRLGIIPDVAHSGQKTALETALHSKKPVVASHSGCSALNDHCRNKHDNVIKAIAKSGGYVGICAMAKFMGRSENINAMLDHIDHISETFGVDHVTIGTDKAFYTSENVPRGVIKSREPFESLWPPDSTDPVRRDEWKDTLAWTNWPIFTVGLVQRGYSDKDIRKIIGGNVLRVAKTTSPPSTKQYSPKT